MFKNFYNWFNREGYFQEHFGYYCVDNGQVPGILTHSLEDSLFLELHKTDLTPIQDKACSYSEEDLFDYLPLILNIMKILQLEYHLHKLSLDVINHLYPNAETLSGILLMF